MNGHELEVLKDPDEGKMNRHEPGRGTLLTSGVGAGDGDGVIAVGGEACVVLCSSGSNDGAATHTDL